MTSFYYDNLITGQLAVIRLQDRRAEKSDGENDQGRGLEGRELDNQRKSDNKDR